MPNDSSSSIFDAEKDFLIIGNPFPFGGGGGKRVYNMIKAFHELGFTPSLYITYGSLLFYVILEKLCKLDGAVIEVFKSLEKHIEIPVQLYQVYDKISMEITKYLRPYRKGGVYWMIQNFLKTIKPDKENLIYTKHFLNDMACRMRKFSFVYVMHELPGEINSGGYIVRSLGKDFFIHLQGPPFLCVKDFIMQEWLSGIKFSERDLLRGLLRIYSITWQYLFSKMRIVKAYVSLADVLTGLLSVSEAPFSISRIDTYMMRKGVPTRIVKPGNAVEEELSIYCHEVRRRSLFKHKGDYAVFYGRLRSDKGLFELPSIAKRLQDEGYGIKLMGIPDSSRSMHIFDKLCNKLGVKNIEYLGFLPKQELYNIVSRAKVLIYPSHFDSFSLVMLEALFLGTSIVAYDIPAVRSVYSELKPVKIVREYDYKRMAEEVLKILKTDESQYVEEHLDPYFQKFLILHSSWKNVAKREIEVIHELRKKF